ncbi:hypothetical protein BDV41DRAFT_580694 [Aspergillus transmontanensis]|uniref:Jacalin-type lectin domain-containing protein n=1 Tax=Aspergillus transmontanensis TaxID=1034304 RepID=A0A5N6VLQ9_9EURO|nr:hypothetical protein BDV41DRAFT_580694 [Aspergillus transmontanensis]
MSDPEPIPRPERDLVKNNRVGSRGGNPHEILGKRVVKLAAMKKRFLQNPVNYAITGIEITTDSTTEKYGDWNSGPESTETSQITFGEDERVTEFVIWAWDWVDSIQIKTSKQQWHFGGTGGAARKQDIGTGKLVGFDLSAGYRLDSLGSIFERP